MAHPECQQREKQSVCGVNYFTQDTSCGNMIVKILSYAAKVYALWFNDASELKGIV